MIVNTYPEKGVLNVFFEMVRVNIGLALDESKLYLLESRLNPLAKKNGFNGFAELISNLIMRPLGELHWEAFEALLTNETMFFRDEYFFKGLINYLLPMLINKNRQNRELNIWCTSVSTGQEVYSLAMILLDHFPELSSWNLQLKATDVCKKVLKRAEEGVFSESEIKRGLTPLQIQKHFTVLDDKVVEYKINDKLKGLVQFDQVNLVKDLPIPMNFDLILMSNVLIYCSAETKIQVLTKISSNLKNADSCLSLGASESLLYGTCFDRFCVDRLTFYKKKQ
jgi:chemotaxis protein methyltransferase CheR